MTGNVVIGIGFIRMHDHAQVLVHQESVAVRRDLRSPDDIDQHVDKNIRRQHTLQGVV